jgi:pimeloyl-ACP methyl ester carboxylesterase
MSRALPPLLAALTLLGAGSAIAQNAPAAVTYPSADGGTIHAELYGQGSHAVLLAHGRIFDKESWAPLARQLESAGYRVLAIDFRGYGDSTAGSEGNVLEQDILGGIRYLHEELGATAVSVIGGSMGGGAAARAATLAAPGQIEALILLSAGSVDDPRQLQAGRILFIASEDEPMTPGIREQHARAPDPKRLVLLPGAAHAQHIFKTDQAARLTDEILSFLAAR